MLVNSPYHKKLLDEFKHMTCCLQQLPAATAANLKLLCLCLPVRTVKLEILKTAAQAVSHHGIDLH